MSAGFASVSPSLQTSSDRRAALTVHALAEQDRQWLMAQLTPDEAARLQPLLNELNQLGIPREVGLIGQLLQDASHVGTASSQVPPLHIDESVDSNRQFVDHDPAANELGALDQAEASDLARMLRHEPPMLVAHLLHMRHWPWAADLLDHMDVSQRLSVQGCLAGLRESLDGTPAALHQALMDAVVQRLKEQSKPCTTATPVPMDADRPLTPSHHFPTAAWSRVKEWIGSFGSSRK